MRPSPKRDPAAEEEAREQPREHEEQRRRRVPARAPRRLGYDALEVFGGIFRAHEWKTPIVSGRAALKTPQTHRGGLFIRRGRVDVHPPCRSL